MQQTKTVNMITLLLVLLFAYTGFSKLFSLRQFETVLWQAPLIGPRAGIVAKAVPVTELLLAVALVIPVLKKKALATALGLLIAFTVYLGYMLAASSHLPCQCGGIISVMSWQTHIAFNLIFIGLTAYALNKINGTHKDFRQQLNADK